MWRRVYIRDKPKRVLIIMVIITKIEFIWRDSTDSNFVVLIECRISIYYKHSKVSKLRVKKKNTRNFVDY